MKSSPDWSCAKPRWYEGQRDGLGYELVAEMRRAIGVISEHPARWPNLTKLSRRYRLNRFPYWIVYQEREDCLRVIAVMHQSRRPNYWRGGGDRK